MYVYYNTYIYESLSVYHGDIRKWGYINVFPSTLSLACILYISVLAVYFTQSLIIS